MDAITLYGLTLDILSDIHLEMRQPRFVFPDNPAQVLILAGDICVAAYLERSEASPYYQAGERTRAFFSDASERYEHILYVAGNHEHYDGRFDRTLPILRKYFPAATILDNEEAIIEGVSFFGGTAWTDLSNPINEMVAQAGLNDYRLIQSPKYRKLRAYDTTREHFVFKCNLAQCNPDAIISHHAPSYESLDPIYGNDPLNAAYATEMQIPDSCKLWIHGHTHHNIDYMRGDTRIVTNCIGYPGEKHVSDYRKGH